MTPPGRVPPHRLRLIAITDSTSAGARGLEPLVSSALAGGASCIQLREKELPAGALHTSAQRLRALAHAHGALFIVNDRFDVALAAGADGVHLGPDDLPVREVRRSVPAEFIVGFSTDDPVAARAAELEGADYIGCGTIWPTSSKERAGNAIGPAGLAAVACSVSIPVVGIGGITVDRAWELRDTGAAGIAVIGAIMGAPDPEGATRKLVEIFE